MFKRDWKDYYVMLYFNTTLITVTHHGFTFSIKILNTRFKQHKTNVYVFLSIYPPHFHIGIIYLKNINWLSVFWRVDLGFHLLFLNIKAGLYHQTLIVCSYLHTTNKIKNWHLIYLYEKQIQDTKLYLFLNEKYELK